MIESFCQQIHNKSMDIGCQQRVFCFNLLKRFCSQKIHSAWFISNYRCHSLGLAIKTHFALLDYINQFNHWLQDAPTSPARLTDEDIKIIRDAIAATICAYDSTEQAIYQPDLYNPHKSLSPVARILSLADIGALGIDGVEVYHQEGSLLVLEENLDLIPLILDGTIYSLKSNDFELYQNIQKRLLNRCRFQVNFAKSRAARLEREIADFPEGAISTLHEVFKYLNSTTIQEVEAKTPTDESATLEVLLQFFEFERYINKP